ncbi:MAG: purine-nucleoside phosphorylase, partial [Acidimicrobiia bacterium]|nr:purine-nucleoside phosphorylase [Acidimicrobiia bacterium]
MDTTLHDRLEVAATKLTEATGRAYHDVAVVLGSGLGGYADRFDDAVAVPYADLPGFPIPGAAGHGATAFSFTAGDNKVLLFTGRAHVYEGYDLDQVTFAVRTAVRHGCHT